MNINYRLVTSIDTKNELGYKSNLSLRIMNFFIANLAFVNCVSQDMTQKNNMIYKL